MFDFLCDLTFYLFFSPVFGVLEYPIVSIEDPFDKEDWEHTKKFSGLGICQVCLFFLLVDLFSVLLLAFFD